MDALPVVPVCPYHIRQLLVLLFSYFLLVGLSLSSLDHSAAVLGIHCCLQVYQKPSVNLQFSVRQGVNAALCNPC